MLHRKYGHAHSAALGFLLALALAPHLLWIVTAALLGGVVIGRAWATWTLWASALREKWHLARRETIPHRPRAVRKVSAQNRDGVPF